jgi:photosystem II stability/assembly factor-like uncharacterized protein
MENKKHIAIAAALGLLLIVWAALTASDGERDVLVLNEPTHKEELEHGHGFAVDPNDPETVYVATHEGLYSFRDGALSRIGTTTHDFMGFTMHPQDSRMMFTSGHPARGGNLGFMRSMNGGMTWEKISDGIDGPVDFHVLAMHPANPEMVYGWYGSMMHRSRDQGRTWETYTPNTAEPISFVPHPTDIDVLYAVTIQGVARSNDLGETWEYVFPERRASAVIALAIDPNAPETLYLYSRQYGLEKSTNNGATWSVLNADFSGELVTNLAVAPSDSTIVYAFTRENSIFRSDNAGESWQQAF